MDLEIGSQPADVPALTPPTVAYHGRFGEAWKLAIKTTFLTVITLGVYRFWAKTRIRRYFWSRITIDGEPLEYVGTGLELFLGFLIVIAIVAPLYAVMSIGQLFLAGSPGLVVATSLLPAVILLALIPVAVFRARRYRLSRTVWRGVRAGQTGGTGQYWIRAVGYGLVTWLTSGFLRPLAHVRLTSFLMNNTWFGQTRVTFEAQARVLIWRWLLFWVLLIGAYGIWIIVLIRLAPEQGPGDDGISADWLKENYRDYIVLVVATLALMLFSGAAYLSYRVFQARYFTRSTRFGQLRFTSNIRFWRVVRIGVLLYLAAGGLIAASAGLGNAFSGAEGLFVGLFIGSFIAGTLFMPFFIHPLLAHFIETLDISGDIDLDAIARNAQTAPKTGEGLASAFDVDAF